MFAIEAAGMVIPAGGQLALDVQYRPLTSGVHQTEIQIALDGDPEPQVLVQIVGHAEAGPDVPPPPDDPPPPDEPPPESSEHRGCASGHGHGLALGILVLGLLRRRSRRKRS